MKTVTFADRLKRVRLASQESQESFARKISVPVRTYQNIESGKTDRVPVSSLEKLQDEGVDIIWLVSGHKTDDFSDTSAPPWLSQMTPLLRELDESGRSELTGWVRGYLSAQSSSRATKSRSKKAG